MKEVKTVQAMEDIPGFSSAEVPQFLSSSKIPLHLATTMENGDAVIHPIWFLYEKGRIFLFTGKDALKSRNIRRTKNAYFSVDTSEDPYRGVKGRAAALFLEDSSEATRIAQAIVGKYMGAYNEYSKTLGDEIKSGESVVIALDPLFYSTWDYGKVQR